MGVTPESLNECWPETQPPPGQGDGSQQLAQQERLERARLNRVPAVWPYGFVFPGSPRSRLDLGDDAPATDPGRQAAPRNPDRLSQDPEARPTNSRSGQG